MGSHRQLTGYDALHQFSWYSTSDPALVSANNVLPYQGWFEYDTGKLYVRNAANDGWIEVSGAGVAAALPFTKDVDFWDGGAALSAGRKIGFIIDDDVTLDGVTAFSPNDETGSATIDFWVDTYANAPPTSADSIVGAGTKLTISSAKKGQDNTMTNWTKVFTGQRAWVVELTTVSTFTRLAVSLRFTRNP